LISQWPVGCHTFDKHFLEQYQEMIKKEGAIREKHT
jgi:hypothetical protein